MTFRSMAKRFFRVVLIALACFLALNVMMWSLYFGVRLATTSYSIDWVVLEEVDCADSSSEINEIKLEFRSFSVCHYFNIFTDIT